MINFIKIWLQFASFKIHSIKIQLSFMILRTISENPVLSVKFSLIESVICLFTDSSVKKYFSLSNKSIFTEIISAIWLIYSNLLLAIWISQILLIISRFWLILISRVYYSEFLDTFTQKHHKYRQILHYLCNIKIL